MSRKNKRATERKQSYLEQPRWVRFFPLPPTGTVDFLNFDRAIVRENPSIEVFYRPIIGTEYLSPDMKTVGKINDPELAAIVELAKDKFNAFYLDSRPNEDVNATRVTVMRGVMRVRQYARLTISDWLTGGWVQDPLEPISWDDLKERAPVGAFPMQEES